MEGSDRMQDVVIVGAGPSGLFTAYEILRHFKSQKREHPL